MIDFRYHLVSIIAVFLALAIGIVVGTTALNGYVVDDLRARNGAVIKDKRNLEGVVRDPPSGRVRKVITTYGPTRRRVAVPMEWVVQHTPTRLVLGVGSLSSWNPVAITVTFTASPSDSFRITPKFWNSHSSTCGWWGSRPSWRW